MVELTTGQKAARTRKRRAAARKAAITRKRRAAGRKAAQTRKRRTAAGQEGSIDSKTACSRTQSGGDKEGTTIHFVERI